MKSGIFIGILFILSGIFGLFDILAARREAMAIEKVDGKGKGSSIRQRQKRSAIFGALFIFLGLCLIVRAYWF
ncbi:MAG: hypothetical protein ACM3S2_21395 [Ignavibacteriales bacterium]